MPQKTRKEKQAAEQRRKFLYTVKEQPVNQPIKTVTTTTKTTNPVITEEDTMLKKYFIMDFRKSLIFIVMIFVLEFIFYFINIERFIHL